MEFINNTNLKNICLETGVANLGYGPLKIHMSQGIGWITHNDEDIVLNEGEQIEFKPTRRPIVISSARHNQPIAFEVEDIAS